MSEVDEAIEKLEKRKKSEGTFKGHVLTLELRPPFISFPLLGKNWVVRLTVGGLETAHEKTFRSYKSALNRYEELKQKYSLEEKR